MAGETNPWEEPMVDSKALTVSDGHGVSMSREQVELVKDTIAREQKLTDDELRLFVYTANRMGLDPLARQIYAVRRKGKIVIQTAIDGYRVIAARTGEYAGNDDPLYEEAADGSFPLKATVSVWRIVHGQRCAFTASARWEEYKPEPGPSGREDFMWRRMPFLMLAKVAEALALRKAFPAELSGVYVDAEMDQAGPGENGQVKAATEPPAVDDVLQERMKLTLILKAPCFRTDRWQGELRKRLKLAEDATVKDWLKSPQRSAVELLDALAAAEEIIETVKGEGEAGKTRAIAQ